MSLPAFRRLFATCVLACAFSLPSSAVPPNAAFPGGGGTASDPGAVPPTAAFRGSGGAASDPGAADTATFSLWHSFRGDEANALETVVATFNEQNADKIRLVQLDGHRFTDEVESALAAGKGPDLIIWAHDKVGPWVEKGWIMPIDHLVPANELEVFIPGCLDALKHNGRLYGLPLSFETLILYYNKNLVPDAPKTTDELIAIARAATDTASGRYGLVYERGNFYFHIMWVHGFGGRVFNDSGDFDVRSPAMVQSLEFARDLSAVHHIIPDTVDWNVEMSLFNSGKAAFLISGPWAYGSLNWSGIPIGISALPVMSRTGRFPSPFLGVKGFFVNARSPYRERLGETLQHLTSAFSGCLMNCLAGYLPANRLAYEFNALSAHPITAKFEEHIDSAVLMPANAEMGHVWRVMIRDDAIDHPGALDRVFLFGVSPEDAVEEAWQRYRAYAAAGGS